MWDILFWIVAFVVTIVIWFLGFLVGFRIRDDEVAKLKKKYKAAESILIRKLDDEDYDVNRGF